MKKWLAVAVASSLLITAACSNGSNTNGDSGKQNADGNNPPAQATPKTDPVELIFYSQNTDSVFMDTFGNMIQEKFPHVKVKHLPVGSNKLADLVASGQPIDIMFWSIGQSSEVTGYNFQYDISEQINKYKYDLNKLEPSAVEAAKNLAGGGIYGLPVFTNTLGLFYNKTLFDKFGVEYPKDGIKWDELKELAKKLSRAESGIEYKGLVMSSSANIVLNQYSAGYIDPVTKKSLFTSEKFQNAFELLTSVAHVQGNGLNAQTWSLAAQQKMFYQDQMSSMLLHFVDHALSNLDEKMDWDIATYPEIASMPGVGPQSYPYYAYITQTSKHKDQAFEVIAYMTSEEFQNNMARRGKLPILKDKIDSMSEFGKDVPKLQGKNVKALLPNKLAPSSLVKDTIVIAQSPGHTAFFEAYKNNVLGLEDVNTALRLAGEKFDLKLKDLFGE
ncbi:extracellular solute-binding protein [Paenibacillus hemerocallicola]|uniref:Extracellular solute-binding protein n=1 Tax=Paenibacillus hemerocallicola TaxID=1172614 RepID=A0A5C4SUP2_9BACL|nr:extracellular solute-binding protein [Paenibacillus hemerocallicola]TNJ53407.1 extracellular solute-binding protein [Paenibacillus hemerocallicola]